MAQASVEMDELTSALPNASPLLLWPPLSLLLPLVTSLLPLSPPAPGLGLLWHPIPILGSDNQWGGESEQTPTPKDSNEDYTIPLCLKPAETH